MKLTNITYKNQKRMDIIEKKLRTIGKTIFADYLYIEVSKNFDITIEELCYKHKDFKNYKLSSQRTKLSATRSLLRKGKGIIALQNIIKSEKVNKKIREKAKLLLELNI